MRFFSLSFKQFCKLSRSNGFNMNFPGREDGCEAVKEAPYIKLHVATADLQNRECCALSPQALGIEVPVWPGISGTIPFYIPGRKH